MQLTTPPALLLPQDIWPFILSDLDSVQVRAVACVSRAFNDYADSFTAQKVNDGRASFRSLAIKQDKIFPFLLRNSKKIAYLWLNHLCDDDLRTLGTLSHLAHFKLAESRSITDHGLIHLSSLSSLVTLDLRFCPKISGVGLSHLSSLPKLTRLGLSNDLGLSYVSFLPKLTSLDLESSDEVTDAGLKHLCHLSHLVELDLSWCNKITDRGLFHLSSLTTLVGLNLVNCPNITHCGAAQLSSSLPKLLNLRLRSS